MCKIFFSRLTSSLKLRVQKIRARSSTDRSNPARSIRYGEQNDFQTVTHRIECKS